MYAKQRVCVYAKQRVCVCVCGRAGGVFVSQASEEKLQQTPPMGLVRTSFLSSLHILVCMLILEMHEVTFKREVTEVTKAAAL